MLREAAEVRVSKLIDDVARRSWSVDEVDDALATAQVEVVSLVAGAGATVFVQESVITTSSAGIGDLTTIKPMELVAVSLDLGSANRQIVLPASYGDAPANHEATERLLVAYTPRPTFPEAAAAFVWGHANVTMTQMLDMLMCLIAASELKVDDDETNASLERRKAELTERIVNLVEPAGYSPLGDGTSFPTGRFSRLRYLMTAPDVLQLVT